LVFLAMILPVSCETNRCRREIMGIRWPNHKTGCQWEGRLRCT